MGMQIGAYDAIKSWPPALVEDATSGATLGSMIAPIEPTPLDWQILGDAAETMGQEGDPTRVQHYYELATGCWCNVMHQQPAQG
jgi:hypothetical protein